MAKRRSIAEQAREERRDQAEGLVSKAHPNYQCILYSWFGIDLVVDVKDKGGEWHRYYHHTNDPTAAAVLGGI